ncbi:hypothetical protein SAMN06265338_13611 [Rhodoblastus acidophilus]|uniref:Transmembrane protein n=1 Tax=Rhodoblastus acidophilus TaxID=1074 RepID=A0A212SFH5_RHOAC|nr:hypothetical protein [Rhodoblastus acidophilus]PPQ37279.1 hypothetical protein CKO16_15140 [Rhodoblastus acidophilus]SNB84474.1 hypothetical protein SAMN06265338_13611 [Rhodoblastus acidophilus]
MRNIRSARVLIAVAMTVFASLAPARAHHAKLVRPGETVGVVIPAISHGEMPVFAKYRAEILDLAARRAQTDPTLRRLQGFISLQGFACFWGLAPGALSDEASPFNECAHGYIAGARALLDHMAEMPGDRREAKALQNRIAADLARDPAASAICSSSNEAFDSGIVVGPDWSLTLTHVPTLMTVAGLLLTVSGGLVFALASHRRRTTKA